jgi:hypothetical protein
MVPKAFSLAIALPRQLTARRLAGCCRVDARFTLAIWTLAFGHLPFGHRSRRTPVVIGTGRCRHSSLLARDGARNPSINRHRSNTQFPTWSRRNIRFLHEI